MGFQGISLLAVLLLSSLTHQVSISIDYEFYHYTPNPICHDIQPGVCCRALYNSQPHTISQISLLEARFRGLEPLDVATIWASNGRRWGCSGLVLDTAIGAGFNRFQVPGATQSATPMTGASYLRLSSRSASMVAAEGIRAFVAGGAKAACAILGSDFKGHFKREDRTSKLPLPVPGRWMWPNLIALNGSNYTELGGAGSLLYRNEEGEELDFPDLRELIC